MQRPPFFRPDVPKSSTNRDFSDLLEDTAKRGGPFLPVRTSERFRTEAPIGDMMRGEPLGPVETEPCVWEEYLRVEIVCTIVRRNNS